MKTLTTMSLAALLASLASAQQYQMGLTKDVLNQNPLETLYRPAAGDFNGDGLVDLAFAGPRFFVNRGTHFDEWPTTLTQATNVFSPPVFVDVDGDGDLDVLFTGSTLRLAFNDGAGAFIDFTSSHLPNVVPFFGNPTFGDIDGDGDLDFTMPGGLLLKNDGNGVFADVTASQVITERFSIGQVSLMEDFDGDGDIDFINSNGLHRNDGRGFFVLDRGAQAQFNYGESPFALDLDRDGDLDLLFADGRVQLNKDGNFSSLPSILQQSNRHNWVIAAAADFDGDQVLDFVISPSSPLPGEVPSWWRNDGSMNISIAQAVPLGSNYRRVFGLVVADLDGDGDNDLVANDSESSVSTPAEVLYNDGHGGWHNATVGGGLVVGRAFNRLVADFDGDGDDDILSSGIGLHRNTGGGDFVRELYPFGDAPDHVTSGDFDGDGDLDLLGGKSLWLNDGLGTFTAGASLVFGQEFVSAATAIDLDGDGDQDVVMAAGVYGQPHTARVMINDGTGQMASSNVTTHGIDPNRVSALASGDFDSDGDQDLAVGRTWPGTSQTYTNLGAGVFANSVALVPFGTVYSLSTIDMDGDGDLDLTDDATRLFINNGAGSFAQKSLNGVGGFEIAPDDVDGDGDQDLWSLQRSTGWLSLHVNDGANNFSDVSRRIETGRPIGSQAVLLLPIDLEGDSDGDVIVFVENRHTQRQFAIRYWNHEAQLRASRLTRVGGTLDLQVSTMGLSAPSSALIGISPVAARVPLGDFGTLGLDLSVTAVFPVQLTLGGGSSSFAVQIPQDRSLRGLTLYAQALFTAPGDARLSGTVHTTIVD